MVLFHKAKLPAIILGDVDDINIQDGFSPALEHYSVFTVCLFVSRVTLICNNLHGNLTRVGTWPNYLKYGVKNLFEEFTTTVK